MLINLRNALMSGKRLPYDAEVEYLESSGTQYINTGVVPTTTKTEITFSTPTPPSSGYMCGSFNANNNRYYPAVFSGSSIRYINLINAANTVISRHTNDGNVHTVVYNATGGACYFDGEAAGTLSTTTLTASNPIYLFRASGAYGLVSGRIYSCKLYDANGTLVRDFIPVRKGSVGYLYDRVSGKLFGNAGTGDFVLGPDVVPVEYIESTGSQWIDTGAPMADRYIFEWLCSDASKDVKLFGNSYAYGRYRDLAIYNSVYRNTNIATESNSWDRVEIDVTRPFLTVTRNGSTFGTASSWWAAYTGTEPKTQYGTALPFGGHINEFGNWYGTNRVTCFPVSFGIKLRTRLFEAWNGLNIKEKLLPVRVGTEGAMIDTLTRRIYRNAGKGAFTYGNDLKYPIPAS